MNITITTIPKEAMRYEGLGDWQFDENQDLFIQVSDEIQGYNQRALIAFHELVEALLCRQRGVLTETVDKFDFTAICGPDDEPGDLPDCPYAKEHRMAMILEHLLAHELGLIGYGIVR